MKRNVDLTDGRDFSIRRNFDLFLDVMDDLNRYEWSKFNQSKEDISIFQTGGEEDRRLKRLELGFGVYNGVCDCCGTTNQLKLLGESICSDCSKRYYSNISSIWWRRK